MQFAKRQNIRHKIRILRIVWQLLKKWVLPVLGVLIFIMILHQISWQNLRLVLSTVNFPLLIIAILTGYCSTVLRTIRFGYFFPAPGRWLNLYGTFAYLRMLYFVLPFNSGEMVYLSVLKKYRFTPTIAETAPTWMYLRLKDIIALAIWTLSVLIFLPRDSLLFRSMHDLHWLFTGIIAALIIFLITLPKLISRFSFKLSGNWLSGRLSSFLSGFNRTSGLKKFLGTLFITLMIWAAIIFSTIFAQFSLATPLSFTDCLMASTATLCITLLPINPPLGIGTGDAAWIGIMIIAGVESSLAIPIAIGLRIISILLILSEGLIGYGILFLYQNKPLPQIQKLTRKF